MEEEADVCRVTELASAKSDVQNNFKNDTITEGKDMKG